MGGFKMVEKKDPDKKGQENKGTQTPSPSKGKFEDNIFSTESENSKQPSESSRQQSESSAQSSESSDQSYSSSSQFEKSEDVKRQNIELNIPPDDIGDIEGEEKKSEKKEGNLKDEIGVTEKVDVRLSPSQQRATKPAINDSPSNRDSIGFTPYVQALARMIIHPKTMTPLTIGILGPWGSGKTSFMKQVKDSVGELDSKIRHVVFNAWKYDVQEILWTAFLQTIVLQIESDLSWIQRWRVKLRSILKKTNKIALFWNLVITGVLIYIASYYLNKFNIKLEWSLIALIPFGALGFLMNPLTKIWKKLKVPLGIDIADMISSNNISENITNFNEFESDLKRILDIYVGKEGRLVIYIDDLDRCSPRKVVDVLETINVFLDTDRCIFLLGMDQPKVVLAINVKFKEHIEMLQKNHNGGGNENEFGEGFLEKIIQIPMYVPKLSDEHIDDFLKNYFDHAIGEDTKDPAGNTKELPSLKDVEIDEQVEVILRNTIECIDKNPRNIKKFLNIFRYIYLLYIANRDSFKSIKEYALPMWFVISYENKKNMATIEKDHPNSTWDDLRSGFNGDYPNIEHIYQQLTKRKEVNNLLSQLNGPIKDYFPLTRLLYA